MVCKVRQKCLVLLTFLIYLRISRCQEVIDQNVQEAPYINEFCPKSRYCEEGTHVMCMYYDERFPIGPRCANYQKVDVNLVRDRILQIINAIRSKVALGEETAKKKQPLPRAYGMFRLYWDFDLARYAQVLADQCFLKHDLCRATKTFGKPGQSLGLIRFSFPDWMPKGVDNDSMIKPGYSEDKLWYSVQGILKSWYDQKRFVNATIIERYPDFVFSNSSAGRLYLEMVVPTATHMGCGMSGFTDITYKTNHNDDYKISHNTIELVCNFSERPEVNKPVYMTLHPRGKHDTERCGCPLGSREQTDCLCVKGPRPNKPPLKFCPNPDENCEQTVVVLPIFTMEDAPEQALVNNDTLQKMKRRLNENVQRRQNSMEIIDFLEGAKRNRDRLTLLSYRFNGTYFGSDSVMTKNQHRQANGEINKKPSIFVQNPKFNLPQIKNYGTTNVKKDVQPRKDFSNAEQMVNRYLKQKHHEDKTSKTNENSHTRSSYTTEDQIMVITTETILSNVEDKIMSFKPNFNNNLPNSPNLNEHHNSKTMENGENKILTLLDNLEREVKHVELDNEKKVIFHEKIRKIYDAIVKDNRGLQNEKQNKYTETRFNYRGKDSSEYENRHPNDVHRQNRLTNRELYNHVNDEHNNDKVVVSYEMHDRHFGNHHGKGYYQRYGSEENYRTKDYDNISKPNYLSDKNKLEHRRNLESHYPLINDEEMTPASMERKIYSEKLNNLERRIHETQSYRRRNAHGAHPHPYLRKMRPTRDEATHATTTRSPIDEYYMPDRARFLHGFR